MHTNPDDPENCLAHARAAMRGYVEVIAAMHPAAEGGGCECGWRPGGPDPYPRTWRQHVDWEVTQRLYG